MVNWTKQKLEALGATVELADVGEQTLPDGTKLALPKVILGTLGNVSISTKDSNLYKRTENRQNN